MKLKTVSMTLIVVVLLSAMLGIFQTSTVAEDYEYVHSLEVSVSPEFPNTNDEVNVTISFVVDLKDHEVRQSPYDCGDFLVVFPWEGIPVPEETNYTFICHLGKLPAGQHDFEAYIAISFCTADGTCTLPLSYLTETTSFTVFYLGDIDCDGDVDSVDFNIFAGAYGTSPPSNPACDLDNNGGVDSVDFNIFAGNYGKTI